MSDKIGPWTRVSSKVVYENPWIEVCHQEVLNPSKKPGVYGVVHFKNLAIGIIPLDENLNTWLVGQHRYPLNSYSWEIPEGGGKLDVDPIDSAKRELLEECGIEAKQWTKIQEMHLSNSVSDERAIIFLARHLTYTESQPEDSEELVIKKLPFSEAYNMVMRQEITDSMSVAGILKVKLLIDLNEIK